MVEWWNKLKTWQKVAVVAVPVVGVLVWLVARSRTVASAPATAGPAADSASTADGGGAPSAALTAISGAISNLNDRVAQLQAADRQLMTQTAELATQVTAVKNTAVTAASAVQTNTDFIKSVSAHIDSVLGAVAPTGNGGIAGTHVGGAGSSGAGGPAGAVTAVVPSPVKTMSLARWVDDDKYAGWITTNVSVDTSSDVQMGIYNAKQLFKQASDSGDQQKLAEAKAEAARYRKLAAERGETLPDWAKQ